MDLNELLSSPHGVMLAALVGIVGAFLLFGVQKEKAAVHKWAGQLASNMATLGLSTTVTAPLADLAAGDLPGAIGTGVSAARYLEQEENRLKEALNVFKTVQAKNPKAMAQLLSDLQSGAPASQLASDFSAATAGLPQLTLGPVATQLHDMVSKVQALASNPSLAPALAHLQPGQGVLAGLLDAGHKMGVAAATAAGTAAGGPVAGAAAGAVANTITIPEGHIVTVTKAPATDASAAA
jgi:hypothetical protein